MPFFRRNVNPPLAMNIGVQLSVILVFKIPFARVLIIRVTCILPSRLQCEEKTELTKIESAELTLYTPAGKIGCWVQNLFLEL
jgi:hypothetical protein